MRKKQIDDIRIYKNELRLKYKTLRRKMPDKDKLDSAIFNKIVNIVPKIIYIFYFFIKRII